MKKTMLGFALASLVALPAFGQQVSYEQKTWVRDASGARYQLESVTKTMSVQNRKELIDQAVIIIGECDLKTCDGGGGGGGPKPPQECYDRLICEGPGGGGGGPRPGPIKPPHERLCERDKAIVRNVKGVNLVSTGTREYSLAEAPLELETEIIIICDDRIECEGGGGGGPSKLHFNCSQFRADVNASFQLEQNVCHAQRGDRYITGGGLESILQERDTTCTNPSSRRSARQ